MLESHFIVGMMPAMRFVQAADAVAITGLTKSQLREWTGRGRRALISPDVEPKGPGRHALYAWQTLLVLRLLLVLHNEFRAEVGAWAPAVKGLRGSLDKVSFPSLWRSSVVFENRESALIVEEVREIRKASIVIPLEPHLLVLSEKIEMPRSGQFQLFAPMVIS